MTRQVAVIGAGSWGTALAAALSVRMPRVTLWCREAEIAAGIGQQRRNPLYLSDLTLPDGVVPSTDLIATASSHDVLVMAIPVQFTRPLMLQIQPYLQPGVVIVSASKGIEVATLTLLSDMYRQTLGPELARRCCYLSGPSFAREVVQQLPTAVVIAGDEASLVEEMQQLCSTPFFRCYRCSDPVGVQLGGALKNIIAIAAGISDGLGLGHNARAALISRGLVEMIRFGSHFGGQPATFAGLSGLGDLLLTATSDQSRNYRVGWRIGCGDQPETVFQGMTEVAEGVTTTLGVYRLAQQHHIDMPITEAVQAILHQGGQPQAVVADLMARSLKAEREFL
ncbi:MAG: NAD(P)-dependent glycerol-3-phosphate dehydrogenase [Magnetococcales bacterium]|nr:NAD(P)-dependent glycerol-3-phosphate dehydrogenase [Magnetococcales bacterium]